MIEVPTSRKQSGTNVPSPEERIETEILKHDEKLREISTREALQRHWIRLFSIIVCGVVLIGMGVILFFASWKIFLSPNLEISMAYTVAIFIAPIVSVTAITIALLIAAFRKFRNEDETSGVSAVASAARTGSSLG